MNSLRRTASQPHLVSALALALAIGASFAAPSALADDAAPPAASPPAAAPAASPPSLAPTPAANATSANTSDKVAQENLFWESAQKSNTLADYKAYLEAFPNGVYAPLAKNRIAALTAAAEPAQPAPAANQPPPGAPAQANAPQQEPGAGPGQPPPGAQDEANAPQQPGLGRPGGAQMEAPPPEAVRAEVGTLESEQSLNLNRQDEMELQRRLSALGLYNGPIDGALGPGSRGAIAQWQQSQGAQPTGMLGPAQFAALRAESPPVSGQRVEAGNCPAGFHPGRYGRRCWVNR